MKALILGKSGQLASELHRTQPEHVSAYFASSQELDIRDDQALQSTIAELKPDVVINAAAYTAVDKAEDDQEAAYAINKEAVASLASITKQAGVRLVHVSTDFVFDGEENTPYKTSHPVSPLGVYGASKQQGEQAVLDQHPQNSCILRTSWVYSSQGNNFVKTMLRLMTEKPELGVVWDQVGSPTWANGLAKACWQFAENNETGIYHYSDLGVASWFDFATAIQEEAHALGLLEQTIPIKPIPSSSFPTPAKRPAYSVLDTSETYEVLAPSNSGMHWRVALRTMLQELVSK